MKKNNIVYGADKKKNADLMMVETNLRSNLMGKFVQILVRAAKKSCGKWFLQSK